MRLTKKEALRIAIELWEWLAETGKYKHKWPGWKRYGDMYADCPLCEYSSRHQVSGMAFCDHCPIVTTGYAGDCFQAAYGEWNRASSPVERRKYAAQFLAQLKEIQERL